MRDKRIGGKSYSLRGKFETKAQAQKRARAVRAAGRYYVRVERTDADFAPWGVWVRHRDY